MKPFSYLVSLVILFLSLSAIAQNTISSQSMGQTPKQVKVSSNDINAQGKMMWSKDWHRGKVQMKPGNIFRLKAIKINFYTNELQYPATNGTDEMAVSIDNMKKIVLFANDTPDTTAIEATFTVLTDPETKTAAFYQVLNDGKIQLLKHTKVGTSKMRVDPIVGQSTTVYFYTNVDYQIQNDGKLTPLKSLGKSNITEAVPESSSATEWLASNKNKLKKEEDVVALLNYLNGQEK